MHSFWPPALTCSRQILLGSTMVIGYGQRAVLAGFVMASTSGEKESKEKAGYLAPLFLELRRICGTCMRLPRSQFLVFFPCLCVCRTWILFRGSPCRAVLVSRPRTLISIARAYGCRGQCTEKHHVGRVDGLCQCVLCCVLAHCHCCRRYSPRLLLSLPSAQELERKAGESGTCIDVGCRYKNGVARTHAAACHLVLIHYLVCVRADRQCVMPVVARSSTIYASITRVMAPLMWWLRCQDPTRLRARKEAVITAVCKEFQVTRKQLTDPERRNPPPLIQRLQELLAASVWKKKADFEQRCVYVVYVCRVDCGSFLSRLSFFITSGVHVCRRCKTDSVPQTHT